MILNLFAISFNFDRFNVVVVVVSLLVKQRQTGGRSATWTYGSVRLGGRAGSSLYRGWRVLFEIKPHTGVYEASEDSVAIDDIEMINCGERDPLRGYNCDFEADFCEWRNDTIPSASHSPPLSWHRSQGTMSYTHVGPRADHTTGTGYYIHVRHPSSGGADQWPSLTDDARIATGWFTPTTDKDEQNATTIVDNGRGGGVCFSFWYHQFGEGAGVLNVWIEERHEASGVLEHTLAWSRTAHSQANEWRRAHVHLASRVRHRLLLQGMLGGASGSSRFADIAVDDTSLSVGRCSLGSAGDDVECDFEDDWCIWRNSAMAAPGSRVWRRSSRFDMPRRGRASASDIGPKVDHTLGTGFGHFLYADLESGDPATGAATQFLNDNLDFLLETSRTFTAERAHCFKFW